MWKVSHWLQITIWRNHSRGTKIFFFFCVCIYSRAIYLTFCNFLLFPNYLCFSRGVINYLKNIFYLMTTILIRRNGGNNLQLVNFLNIRDSTYSVPIHLKIYCWWACRKIIEKKIFKMRKTTQAFTQRSTEAQDKLPIVLPESYFLWGETMITKSNHHKSFAQI